LDIPALAELLHETSERHGAFEAVTPPHHWWTGTPPTCHTRETGATPDESSAAADRYMAEVKHVVPKT